MSKIQIRKSVFETNSSSSHSLTMGTGDLSQPPFDAEVLRSGIIPVTVGEYGWEYFRYYMPINKIKYLLTQVTRGSLPSAEDLENEGLTLTESVREDSRIDRLFKVVEEHTGCKIEVQPGSGYVDHDSDDVGMDLLRDTTALHQFLFDQSAYIETSNDNDGPPWQISNDKPEGAECYFVSQMRKAPKSYVKATLTAFGRYSISALSTALGGCITRENLTLDNPTLWEGLQKQMVICKARVFQAGPYNDYAQSDMPGLVVAQLNKCCGKLAFSPNFGESVSYEFRRSEGKRTLSSFSIELSVLIAPALLRKLNNLGPAGVSLYLMSDANEKVKSAERYLKNLHESEHSIKSLQEARTQVKEAEAWFKTCRINHEQRCKAYSIYFT